MAEAIGIASGLLALATFAFQSSITLCNTIRSFQHHPKRVRDLAEELEALGGVLGPLTEMVSAKADGDFSALDLPLLRCGNLCKEFEQVILQAMGRSKVDRTSFRDWAKLRYMGEDIDGFRRILAGYKLTISTALTDVTLRKSSVTAENLENYKCLIETTTADFEAHLESIDEKLLGIFEHVMTASDEGSLDQRTFLEEQLSTKKCLQICAHLSHHIDQIELRPGDAGPEDRNDGSSFSENVTHEALQECKHGLVVTAAKLEGHMRGLMDRLVTKSKTAVTSKDDAADLVRLRDEWDTARQCIDICSKADQHIRDRVSTIDNYATGDAVQFMVSTDGTIIHGKNRGLGWRTRQVGGHVSNETVQQISRDMSGIVISNFQGRNQAVQDKGSPSTNPNFRARYGPGFKLTSKSDPDAGTPTGSSIEQGQASK